MAVDPISASLSAAKFPHLFSWYGFVSKCHPMLKEKWPAAPAPPKEVDEMDLFGDSDEDDAEAAKKAAAAAKEAAGKKKKEKKVVIAMSLVMLEVKPLDDTTNLDDLAQKIFSEIT